MGGGADLAMVMVVVQADEKDRVLVSCFSSLLRLCEDSIIWYLYQKQFLLLR